MLTLIRGACRRIAVGSCIPLRMETSAAATGQLAGASDETLVGPASEATATKRTAADQEGIEADGAKRAKLAVAGENSEDRPYRKKKVAVLMVYSGKGYMGMQRNPGATTIEDELLKAMQKAGVITQEQAQQPGPMLSFQRAARTDKGVSASGQLVSTKILIDVENPVEKINSNLPEQIRVLGIKRTTKGFNCKNACMARTYTYTLPTFAFAPLETSVTEDYRVTEDVLKTANETLDLFRGTHNFHNFTSGKKPDDNSAKRYIMSFKCGQPFVREGLEFVVITVKGQSFMLHQIRKMIGITIAIVQGLASKETIDKAWGPAKVDIPKAPGLGLVLGQLHYDVYNKRYGSSHEKLEWDEYKEQIETFSENFINKTIIETEKTEKSMFQWLSTLPLHTFDILAERTEHASDQRTAIAQAAHQVHLANQTTQAQPQTEHQAEDKTEHDAIGPGSEGKSH